METPSHGNNIRALPTKKTPKWVLTPEEEKEVNAMANEALDSLNKSIQKSKKKSS